MKFLILNRFDLIIVASLLFMSCKKDTAKKLDGSQTNTNYSSAKFFISAQNSNVPVIWDSLNTVNASGNIYSLHNINFYISSISLKRTDGFIYNSNKIFYIDLGINDKSTIQLDSIPKGDYNEIRFLIGIDSLRNIDFGLGTTIDNLNMAWPTVMGGGYHFIKMEGHYLDSLNISHGFAIHLGRNENLVHIGINKFLSQQNVLHQYSLLFNVNEIFVSPYLYNLNIDNNYTMTDSSAMSKIKSNMQDAFSIIQNN